MNDAELASATTEELLASYIAEAGSYGQAIGNGRHRVANSNFDLTRRVLSEMERRDPKARLRLSNLLVNADPGVRLLAAADLLPVAPEQAVAALEEMVAGPPSPTRLMAEIALQDFRSGHPKT